MINFSKNYLVHYNGNKKEYNLVLEKKTDDNILLITLLNNSIITFKILFFDCSGIKFYAGNYFIELTNNTEYSFELNCKKKNYFQPFNTKEKFFIKLFNFNLENIEIYNLKNYEPLNDINDYIKFSTPNPSVHKIALMDILKNGNNYNYFKIDIFLYKYLHDLQNNKFNIIKDIIDNGIENGLIYHIEQLKNLFPDSNIFCDNNEIFIKNNLSSELKLFVNKEIYNKDFYFFINNFIQEIDNCLIDSDLLLLVFVGNKDVGEILLNKIKNYSNNEDFALGICFRNKEIHNQLIEYIKNNFLNYAVFITNEFGNDIIPTLIMYKHIIKKINFTYIIKLHTKS